MPIRVTRVSKIKRQYLGYTYARKVSAAFEVQI